ncbi:hypothetical protein [Pseudomonas paracarnis]
MSRSYTTNFDQLMRYRAF